MRHTSRRAEIGELSYNGNKVTSLYITSETHYMPILNCTGGDRGEAPEVAPAELEPAPNSPAARGLTALRPEERLLPAVAERRSSTDRSVFRRLRLTSWILRPFKKHNMTKTKIRDGTTPAKPKMIVLKLSLV